MVAPLIAVVGLQREAKLVGGPGIVAAAGGGQASSLRAQMERLAEPQRPRAVISIGLGGALSPGLDVGDWVVADRIVESARSWPTDAGLTRQLDDALRPLTLPTPQSSAGRFPLPQGEREQGSPPLPLRERVWSGLRSRSVAKATETEWPVAQRWEGEGSHPRSRLFTGAIAGSDVMVVDAAAKAALHAATGALAVDMESHVAAAFAAEHGIPFAALRVISDGADRALPKAAQAGMKADGGMDVLAVVKALARDPRQLPALIRTGREAEVAFRRLALLNRHDLLGRLGVGDPDLG